MSPVHHPPRDPRSLSRTLTLPPTPTSTRNLRPHPAPLAALPSRREALVASSVALVVPLLVPPASSAAPPGFKKDLSKGRKDKIPRENYTFGTLPGNDAFGVYEVETGTGRQVEVGDRVVVHFVCKVSTWQGRSKSIKMTRIQNHEDSPSHLPSLPRHEVAGPAPPYLVVPS